MPPPPPDDADDAPTDDESAVPTATSLERRATAAGVEWAQERERVEIAADVSHLNSRLLKAQGVIAAGELILRCSALLDDAARTDPTGEVLRP